MDSGQFVEFHPKIGIADGMILLPPMAAFPVDHPERDALLDILGIRRDLYFTGLFERDEALNRRHQLHSVIGGVRIVTEELLLQCAESEDAGPATGTGITQA